MLQYIFAILIGYIVGSVPTGYWIVKWKTGQDLTEVGSGSTGATNVKRVLGTKWFFIVMLLDAIKGALAIWLVMNYVPGHNIVYGTLPAVGAMSALVGHCKSVFVKFKGGKSVATYIGTLLAIYWPIAAIVAVIWGVLTYASKYVSVGSIIAVSLSPLLMYLFDQQTIYIQYTSVAALYILWTHRENIKRLTNGNENKVR